MFLYKVKKGSICKAVKILAEIDETKLRQILLQTITLSDDNTPTSGIYNLNHILINTIAQKNYYAKPDHNENRINGTLNTLGKIKNEPESTQSDSATTTINSRLALLIKNGHVSNDFITKFNTVLINTGFIEKLLLDSTNNTELFNAIFDLTTTFNNFRSALTYEGSYQVSIHNSAKDFDEAYKNFIKAYNKSKLSDTTSTKIDQMDNNQ